MAPGWQAALLLFCLPSLTHAVIKRPDLSRLNADPAFVIAQLEDDESHHDGFYLPKGADTNPNDLHKVVGAFVCQPDRSYRYRIHAGVTLVACCRRGEHLSGNSEIGFGCCPGVLERMGSRYTGYACRFPGQHVSGDATTNDRAQCPCCDHGTERTRGTGTSADFARCPEGHHVSGDATNQDPRQYMCCPAGKERTGSESTGYVCCGAGEIVVGSDAAGHDCHPDDQSAPEIEENARYLQCDRGHEHAGTPTTGYVCCPKGQTFDGRLCRPPSRVCSGGKQLDGDGNCVCPTGLSDDGAGNCTVLPPRPNSPAPSSATEKPYGSGVVTGSCYQIANRADKLWGFGTGHDAYAAATGESASFQVGKFQFCMDEICSTGIDLNPSDGFSIRDKRRVSLAGQKPNAWLTNLSGGGHIRKSWDWSEAGRFSITKWPRGSYCIAGYYPDEMSSMCSAVMESITSTAVDPEACLEVTLTEVPCNIRDMSNNRIWQNPSG